MKIHYLAFQPSLAILWHREPSEESFKLLAERRSSALKDKGSYVFKAVDTDADNKIIGVANWHVHPEQRDSEELKKNFGQTLAIPEVNAEARKAFMENINQSRAEIMGGAPVVMLGTLTIRPEYQRKGVGTLLMKYGIEEADRLGIRSYLEASAAGKGLYLRYGYKPVKNIEFDTRPYGGDFTDIHTVMIREPELRKESETAN